MTPECEKALQEAYAAVLLEQRNAARAEVEALKAERDEYKRICIEFGNGLVGAGRAGMIDMERLLRAVWDLDKLEKAHDDLSALINPEDQ